MIIEVVCFFGWGWKIEGNFFIEYVCISSGGKSCMLFVGCFLKVVVVVLCVMCCERVLELFFSWDVVSWIFVVNIDVYLLVCCRV